ncbi:unnamed protein product [Microthlaspi erraticum]|uniref:Uncharacterized protein n=1 Tax=Microthlaspi erraticum TaxID=1685480 RepID=A0A6D2JAZ9_9BRAS|nr:unnamed protein product [Microthlaspi erraticum]
MVLMRGGLSNRNVPHQGFTDTPPVLRGKKKQKRKLISEVVKLGHGLTVFARNGDDTEGDDQHDDAYLEANAKEDAQHHDAGQEANAEEGDQPVGDQTTNKEHESENTVAQAPESNHTDGATRLPDSQTAETPDSNTKKKKGIEDQPECVKWPKILRTE